MEVRLFYFILFFLKKFYLFLFSWNEWLTLPLRYCDLPRQAILALSIHEIISPTEIHIIGSTTIPLFDSEG
jgi:phosphatidylinositol 3-kinase